MVNVGEFWLLNQHYFVFLDPCVSGDSGAAMAGVA
jgi:hypothetical protein